MRTQSLKVLTLLGLLTVFAAARPAYSQSRSYTINVPFQFSVEDKVLPASVYTIAPAFQTDWTGLTIHSREGRDSATFLTSTVQSVEHPYMIKLVFNRYGDRYFLSQVFKSRERTGRKLNKARAERELAERGVSPVVVVLGSR